MEKQRWKSQGGEVKKWEDQRRERKTRKKMQAREKLGKSRFAALFTWLVAQEGRKVSSLKWRVQSQLARWEIKNCTPLWREAHLEVKKLKAPHVRNTLEVEMSKKCAPLWREAHFQVKMHKTHHVRTTFGSCDVEKVHAVVVRSTFPSQNVQTTPCSDHFWKLRCRKSARRCGAKHVSKSKCTKHTMFGPLFEVEMSKECCTLFWREAHFEVNSVKNCGFGPLLDVQMPFCMAGARDCAPCQKWAKRDGLFAVSTTTTTTIHHTTLNYTKLHQLQLKLQLQALLQLKLQLHYTIYSTLQYTTLQLHVQLQLQLQQGASTTTNTLHYTTLHYNYNYNINNNSTTLHYTQRHYATLHLQLQLQLRYFTLHYTRLHYITLTLPYITLDPVHLYNTTAHHNYNSTTLQLQLQLHYTTLHPAVVGEVTTATIATTPKNTTPTTCRSISGFALPSVIHNNQCSDTALCGTTGNTRPKWDQTQILKADRSWSSWPPTGHICASRVNMKHQSLAEISTV